MMRDGEGFTLVEILAVVVILAILTIVTVPIVVGIIEDTRKNRFLEDVKSIVSAIEQYNSENDMKAIGSYIVKQKDVEYKGDKNVANTKVPFKGNFGGAGDAFLNKSGLIRLEIENDKWCVHGTNKEYLIDEGDCSQVGQDLLVTYSVDKTGWAPKKVVTVQYPEREDGLMYDYSLDGGKTWLEVRIGSVAKVEFTKPGTIIARVFDGIHYQTGNSFAVTQIDSTAPTDVTLVLAKKTSSSIDVSVAGTDLESGIAKIEFSKDDGKTWVDNGRKDDYQFNKLKAGTYPLKARMTNQAGLSTISNSLKVTTSAIDAPTYAVDKTGWQTKKVVTITYPKREDAFIYQYSLDGGKTWKTVSSPARTQQLTFTANGTVIARVYDGTNYVTASSFSVTQVDATGPSAVAAVSTKTTNSIAIKATCTDAQSGITKIEYSKDNGSSYVSGGTNTTYTFTGLKSGTYNFKVRCTNGSGMTATSTAVSGATNTIGTPTYAVDKTGWQPKKVVTITYPARQSNFTYQYSLDGGSNWTTVASPTTTQQLTFTSTGTVIARVYDGTNYVTASSFAVTQIDSTAPSLSIASYTPASPGSNGYYSQNITIKLQINDTISGVAGYEYALSTDGGSTYQAWSSLLNTSTFTMSTEGSNIVVKFRAKDIAGNYSSNVTTKVLKLDKGGPTYTRAEVKNVTATGYDVYVYGVADNGSGINRIQFPTWTSLGSQDDIQSAWETNSKASGTNQGSGTWKYHVNVNDHMKEGGIYNTHVYLYDNLGKATSLALPSQLVMVSGQNGSLNLASNDTTFNNRTVYVGTTPRIYANATYEFDAAANRSITIMSDTEGDVSNKTNDYVQNWITPEEYGGTGNDAGVGISIGTNGVNIVAHKQYYYYSVLSWSGNLGTGFHKYRVSISNNTPKLYIDNQLIKTGRKLPLNARGYFTNVIGQGNYGKGTRYFTGKANYFNFYNYAR